MVDTTTKTQKTVLGWKKKKWCQIVATKEFNDAVIGETTYLEPDNLIGRTVQVSLMELTNDIKKQHMKLIFKVEGIKDNHAITSVVAFEVSPLYIRRMVRREKKKIDDSFIVETKDNVKVRIKTFFVTKAMTSNRTVTDLRKKARLILTEEIKKLDYNSFVLAVVSYEIQKKLHSELKKVYPLSVCQIRCFERL